MSIDRGGEKDRGEIVKEHRSEKQISCLQE